MTDDLAARLARAEAELAAVRAELAARDAPKPQTQTPLEAFLAWAGMEWVQDGQAVFFRDGVDGDETWIATTETHCDCAGHTEAALRFLAAAPRMWEALREYDRIMAREWPGGPDQLWRTHPAKALWPMVRAALAAAGEVSR